LYFLRYRYSEDHHCEKTYLANRGVLDELWETWLKLGRRPDDSEVANSSLILEAFGSLRKAFNFLEKWHGAEALEHAFNNQQRNLRVYIAMGLFEKRRPYKTLNKNIQLDIKAFFGSIRVAQNDAKELLYTIADTEAIAQACKEAQEHGLGWLNEGQSLQLHVSLVNQLPAVLRVYIGCGSLLYGDYENADLVKVHIYSGKLSLMRFDDFEGSPLPRMIERVKIKFRDNEIDYFDYVDEFEPPILFHKSRYINEEFPNFPEQLAFEEKLEGIGLIDFSGYGPRPEKLEEILTRSRWEVEGFELVRAKTIPSLDAPCGEYFTFRQLIECGETQVQTGLLNQPIQPESYSALFELAALVLDPVIDYFGMIKLTYGFCSSKLAKAIPAGIAPKLDQHAAHEINQKGNPICERLGAAADFIVEDESMLEVAQWVVQNTPFDRLYFYGADKPVHVSYGPENNREIVIMKTSKDNMLIPKVVKSELFTSICYTSS